MAASLTSPSSGDFAERVDYPALYTALEQRGLSFTPEDKQTFEKICTHELNEHQGGLFNGNIVPNLAYILFAFIQNISRNGLGEIGASASEAWELNKLNHLKQATDNIGARMREAGGNLAAAADLVASPAAFNGATPPSEMASLVHQLGDLGIALNNETSLNARASGQFTAPPRYEGTTPTRPLTGRQ